MLADYNTKPSSGSTLRQSHQQAIGFQFYPPKDSQHFELLQLQYYDIHTNTSQRIKGQLYPPSKRTTNS